jgi:cation diffusion facilitator family transporter
MPDKAERAVGSVLWLSVVTMVVEIAAGHLSGSMALLADGWHMATHVAALGISAFAYAYMRKHAGGTRFSFGPGKISYLAAYSSSLLLAGVALTMLFEAATRLFEPRHIHYDEALAVAALGLAVNLVSAWLLHGRDGHHHDHDDQHHDHDRHGHTDQNMRAAYVHVVADALTSIAAIAALVAGKWAGLDWLDPVIASVGGLLILRWAWGLARDSSSVLLDRQVEGRLLDEIEQRIAEFEGDVLDLHLWLLAPGRYALMLSVRARHGPDAQQLRRRLGELASLAHVTLDVLPNEAPSVAPQQSI